MKKYISLIFLTIFLCAYFCPKTFCHAEDGDVCEKVYIYDESGNLLIEKSDAMVDDKFIDKDFNEWTIYHIDNNIGVARKTNKEQKPRIKIKSSVKQTEEKKNICLYMTHNDESYLPSDGYDSIYGIGGIHDIAKDLKSQLENLNIKVHIDETLHIPHDSNAYSRSKLTANNLQTSYNPNGLFDIHRDGVAKSVYLSQNETTPLSKIRIVVGKSNPNFEENYAFAKEIFSVGQALYPWLFLDIYLGKGTYNQNIQNHALLFEMGTYLIEKEYVLNSTPYLANVIDTVLFKTSTEENGDIVISEETIGELEENYENLNNLPQNDENLPKNTAKTQKNTKNTWIFALLSIFIISTTAISIFIFRKKNRPE